MTLALLMKLLNEGLVKAGMPDAKGNFESWRDSSDEIIRRIETEWDRLGKQPGIGDVVWFTTTEKGDAEIASRGKLCGG